MQLPAAAGAVCDVVSKPHAKLAKTTTRSNNLLLAYRDHIEPQSGEGDKSRRLRSHVVLLSLKMLPLRVAKFDVVLNEAPLQAVRAKHTVTDRMLLFTCNTCRERFPAFHPVYEPPSWLDLDLLKRGANGVALCNV